MTIFAILLIGFATGLRGMTSPAVVAWCAYLGWIDLYSTPFSFMSSPIALAIFSLLAVGEYVWDLLPNTPSRTALPGLISRVVTGSFTAACLLASAGDSLVLCLLGGLAAICGALAGYQTRVRLVRALGVKDMFVAIPEDFVAIGLSVLAICLTRAGY